MAVSPISQIETQGGIAAFAQPYVETMLGATMQNLFNVDPSTGQVQGLRGYQPYSMRPEDYVAGFTPLQEQARQGIASLRDPGYAAEGAEAVRRAIESARNFERVSASPFAAPEMQAAQTDFTPTLEQFQMGPAERIGEPRSVTEQGALQAYMSPYMQQVVDVQQQQAKRQAAIAQQALAAQAARSGAFGGSGAALQRAQANAQLQRDLQGLQATGLQSAFQNAQQQFNAEQQARMQAALANQQAGLQVGAQNLAAKLGVQQLGTQTGLQTALANLSARQQAAVQNQASKLQTAGMNAQQALQAALANQQAGLQASQQAISGAGVLGNLGTAQLQNQLGILGAQNQFGAQEQAMNQRAIDQAVQNYNTAQQYPYMQLGFMQNMLGGLPISTSSRQEYQAAPSLSSQLLGAGTALIGANQMLGGGSKILGGTGTQTGGGNTLGQVGGILGGLNNLASGVGNVVSSIGSVFGFAEGGNVKQAPPPKKNKAPMGLQALALSKI